MGRAARPTWVSLQVDVDRRRRGAVAPWTTQQIFVAPAGTYALRDAAAEVDGWAVVAAVQFCLGTVAFHAEPGSVLDLGEITIRPGPHRVEGAPPAPFSIRIAPPNIESDRALLARAPELAARLTTAQYRNGLTHACMPQGRYFPPYGFDLPGAE